ncbi:MAG: hypothetical protein J6T29_00505 [Alphaproteobacteria bacterium]|nr:hypothetical protein [Alphaproteobacteria bacterium]
MKDRWKKSWYVWIWLVLEILGKRLIGGNSPIYPFFTAGVVAIFEIYILLKLPYFEKLLVYEESANNPKYTQIRWIGLIPILALTCFSRTLMWYFVFYYPLTEMAVLYFFGTEEEKNKVRADIFVDMKGLAIVVIVLIAILVPYSIYHFKWMHDQFDKISASVNNPHPSAQPSR